MEAEELKRKLLGLWEKTTHNSKDLLAVLFDYYFCEDLIEYKENDGKVVSALCGIPFFFGFGQNRLRGLYVIPMSSEEGFRKKGIQADLFSKLNERKAGEYDFTFLMPHTDLLADYYGSQGYLSSFFILEERFTPLHDFKNDYLLSLNESDQRIRELKKGLLDEIRVEEHHPGGVFHERIIAFIEEIEKKGTASVNLCHTTKDLDYILAEDSVRNLKTFVAIDDDNNIVGVAFAEKEELKRIRIVAIYVTDNSAYFALLDAIKHRFEDHSISINTSDPKYQSHSLIQQNYASANPQGGDLDNTFSDVEIPFNINRLMQPLGMARLLRFDKILKYIAETHSDADFKLHIRGYEPVESLYFEEQIENEITDEKEKSAKGKAVFIVKNGKCKIIRTEDPLRDRSITVLSKKEVSELLLRKNDSSNLIMEAFGIPRLNLQFRLLPC